MWLSRINDARRISGLEEGCSKCLRSTHDEVLRSKPTNHLQTCESLQDVMAANPELTATVSNHIQTLMHRISGWHRA